MDPISVIVGAGALATGYLSGRRQRRRAVPITREGASNACECGHGRHTHDGGAGACGVGIKVKVYTKGLYDHDDYRECACRVFVAKGGDGESERVTRLHALLRRVRDANALLPQLPLELATDLDVELKGTDDG